MMSSAVDKILEVFPTSKDISNLLPSVPRVHVDVKASCDATSKSCSRCVYRTFTRITNSILTRILKNPNQTIAIWFLLGMGALFVLDYTNKSTYPANSVRGSTTIKIEYDLDDEEEKLIPQHPPMVQIPVHFNYLTSNNATLRATPVFWSISRSGGTTVRDIMGKCRGMVIAGAWVGSADKLNIVHENGMKQVTVDLSTKESRTKARDDGLKDVASNLLVLSPNVYETSDIFKGSFQADLWTWFRHPVERQISYYFWLKSLPLGHPKYHPYMQMLTLTDWAQTQLHIPNAMTASLIGIPTNPMGWTEIDLIVAKNMIRQSARIGLLEQKTESIRRFFHHHNVGASGARECQERLLYYDWSNKGKHDPVGKKSDAYQLLLQANSLDVKLYEYATYLFKEQAELFE